LRRERLAAPVPESEGLDAGALDEKDFRAALVQFGPLWDTLSTREQARISYAVVARGRI
jgi:hypothetical protein